MAFESLSERLGKAFKNITGKGKLSEKNMNDMLREVRMSLLEADVNYGVVKDFIARVKEKALGTEVMKMCIRDSVYVLHEGRTAPRSGKFVLSVFREYTIL